MTRESNEAYMNACECCDSGCPVKHGSLPGCERPATQVLHRTDMEDEIGIQFCDDCASDAIDAGVFSTRD